MIKEVSHDRRRTNVFELPQARTARRLTWLAGTDGMTDQDFKETLETFAESALQHRAERLIIDMLVFKHRPSAEILAWRDDVTVGKLSSTGRG